MNPPGYQWSPGEAAALNEFLNSPVGKKFLTLLMLMKPQVDLSGGSERAALTGAFAAGYEHLLMKEMARYRSAVSPETNVSAKSIDPTKD